MVDPVVFLELILFVGLLFLSGFFSGSETALFSLNRTQLIQMERDKHPQVGLVRRLLSEPRRLIVTILIGNELVNVSASVISATLIMHWMGGEEKWWLNIFVMLPILLLFGEITPKTLAMKHNVLFASTVSPWLEKFAKWMTPLRVAVRYVADALTTFVIGKGRSRGNIVTEDMVRTLAAQATDEGVLDSAERQYIENIFDFGNKNVLELSTPPSNMVAISLDTPAVQIIERLHTTKLTRIPIYQGDQNTIVGILHVRDLLNPEINLHAVDTEGLRALLRKPLFVPATQSVADLFFLFRKKRRSFALVLDEFGGIVGLVTMTDLLGAIFGSLQPVATLGKGALDANGDTPFRIEGGVSIDAFNRQMETTISAGLATTMGGWLLHHFGELPEKGAAVALHGWRFTVLNVADNRIVDIECRHEEPLAAGAEEGPGGVSLPPDVVVHERQTRTQGSDHTVEES